MSYDIVRVSGRYPALEITKIARGGAATVSRGASAHGSKASAWPPEDKKRPGRGATGGVLFFSAAAISARKWKKWTPPDLVLPNKGLSGL